MKKLKILFMTENFSDNVCIRHLYELERAIGRTAFCRWAGPKHPRHRVNESISETVRRVMPKADWVFYYDFGLTKRGKTVKVPLKEHHREYNVVAYVGDIQRQPYKYLRHLNECGWDALLMAYIKTQYQIIPRSWRRGNGGLKHDVREIPVSHYTRGLKIPYLYTAPSINPEVFKPLGLERKYDVTMIGALQPDAYPLRQILWDEIPDYAEEMGWNTLMRKGPIGPSLNRNISSLIGEHYVGELYTKALNQSKIFIFGASVFKYVLFKFPEAMACKALVMSDVPITAEEYHLKAGENFVSINEENWRDKLKYYLENDDEREEIAENGYETVMKYHTTNTRAREVVKFLGEQI